MNIDQARRLARKAGMIRAMREAEHRTAPLTNRALKFTWTNKQGKPVARPPFFQNNGLVCGHCKLAWEACKPCNRTFENAQAQTRELRAQLGIEGFDL